MELGQIDIRDLATFLFLVALFLVWRQLRLLSRLNLEKTLQESVQRNSNCADLAIALKTFRAQHIRTKSTALIPYRENFDRSKFRAPVFSIACAKPLRQPFALDTVASHVAAIGQIIPATVREVNFALGSRRQLWKRG